MNSMSRDLQNTYRRMRAPDGLSTALIHEYETRAKPGLSAPVAAFASIALVAAAAIFVMTQMPADDVTEQIAQAPVTAASLEPSPSALTAYTGELGQLSVSRLRLPAKPDLTGVTSVPALPVAPSFPTTL